jgi:hypothetical protein
MARDSNRLPSPAVRQATSEGGKITVLVDAENVRRSRWPNLSKEELVDRVRAWAEEQGVDHLVVFDGRPPADAPDLVAGIPTADDWLAEHAEEYAPYWLVTSDRELRDRAGRGAERIVGGGRFLEELGVSR